MTQTRARRKTTPSISWAPKRIAGQRRLLEATDHGHAVTVSPAHFGLRSDDWGPYADTFLRFNAETMKALDVRPEV